MKMIINKLRYTLLLGFVALAALGNSLNAQTVPPYTNGFNSTAEWNWWTVIDVESDQYTSGSRVHAAWTLYNNCAQYLYHSTKAADDWLVTSPITLQAGITYTFSFVATTGSGYDERLEVRMASSGSESALKNGTVIVGSTTFRASSGRTFSEDVTVNQSGNYYFGIHCTSDADMNYLNIDDFAIKPNVPTIEASPTTVNLSINPGGTETETVVVTGEHLSQGITATLSDPNNVFTINPTSLGTTGGNLTVSYSPTAVSTHTATITLSSAGAQDVIIYLNGACEQQSIICDATGTNGNLPVYGTWFDSYTGQHNQMLYPVGKFQNKGMDGKKITKITFYPQNGINFYRNNNGGTVTIRLANMPSNTTGYASSGNTPKGTEDDFVTVKTITLPTSKQENLTEWVFDDLENEFIYNGGDLLIDVTTTQGGYGSTTFYGENQSSYTGYISYTNSSSSGSGSVVNNGQEFLPKVKFNWEDSAPVTSGTVTPSALDFAALAPGQSSSLTVTVTNTGNQSFTPVIDTTNLPAEFTVSGNAVVNPNGTNDLTVTFAPTAVGTYSGSFTVTIPVPDGTDIVYTVNVTGTCATVYSAEVAPNPVSFGNVQVGQSATMTVTLTNTGNQSITSATIDASGLTGFSVSPTSSGAIAPNGTQNFTVTFTPTAEDYYHGSFTVTIPVPNDDPIVLTVDVTGNGYEYSPTTLMSNVTAEIPVHKSEVKTYGTYIFTQNDVEDDIDMSLSYDANKNGKVDVLVKNEEPVVQYDLKYKEGQNGSWSTLGSAVQQSDPNSYVVNQETFTIPSNATEMWVPMSDAGVNGSTIYYVPVTVANSIVSGGTQGNTYGAPQVQAEKDPISFYITISGHKSDQRPGGHWMQKVMVDGQETEVDYCVYTLVINIHNVTPAFDETRKPYKLRAWLLENESIPYFDFDRVPNENDPNHSHIEGSAEPLTCPKLLGECTDFSGTSYYIGDDYIAPEQNQGADPNPWGSVKLQNAFAAPSNMEQTGIEVAVRAYYYKEDEVNPSLMLLNRDGDAPADGYGMGEGEGHAQSGSIVTAVNELSIDRQVVDVKYVNVQGMQSDRPFDGLNIVVTRYSDGSTTATKVVR